VAAMMVYVVWQIDTVHWWISLFQSVVTCVEGGAHSMRAIVALIMIGAECRPEFGTEEFPAREQRCRMRIVGASHFADTGIKMLRCVPSTAIIVSFCCPESNDWRCAAGGNFRRRRSSRLARD
jgi:hypothetical protein